MSVEAYSKMLKGSYFDILTFIADSMSTDDKVKLKFWCRKELSRSVLESNQPLKWFDELERRGKIAADNLAYLEDFLKHAGLGALYKDVKRYQAKREQTLKSMKKTEGQTDERNGICFFQCYY